MINLVIAMMAEAAPAIKHWNLKKRPDNHPFPIYEGDNIRLVISGKGKCHSAAATSWLASLTGYSRTSPSIWVNLGIAGHRTYDQGTLVTASKLIDQSTGNCWYPVFINNRIPQSTTVCTVDIPSTDYPELHAYDMEATGFYQTATRFTTAELAQCIKVISDNEQQSTDKINASLASDIISDNIHHIDEQFQALLSLTDSLDTIDTEELESCFYRQYKFSATQKHMLRRLLVRHLALFGHLDIDTDQLHVRSTGKTAVLLKQLNSLMNRYHS